MRCEQHRQASVHHRWYPPFSCVWGFICIMAAGSVTCTTCVKQKDTWYFWSSTVGKQLQIYGFFYTAPKHKARTDDDRNQTKSNPNYKKQMSFRVHMGSVSSPASTYWLICMSHYQAYNHPPSSQLIPPACKTIICKPHYGNREGESSYLTLLHCNSTLTTILRKSAMKEKLIFAQPKEEKRLSSNITIN